MKYKDLTPEQKKAICNGCGGKGSLIPVPEFLFGASCNHHDFEYWRGGTKEDRKKADVNFYKEAVRMFGVKYFHCSKVQRDEKTAIIEESRI